MRKYLLGFLLPFVLLGGVVLAQQDPFWHPLNPFGTSAGVSYGTVRPSLASIGANPGSGLLFIDLDGAADSGPILEIYDGVNDNWEGVGGEAGELGSITITAAAAGDILMHDGTDWIDATTLTGNYTFTGNVTSTTTSGTGLVFTAGSAISLHITDGSSTSDVMAFGTSTTADAQFYFDGANMTVDLDGAAGNDFDIDLGATAIVQIEELATNNQFLLDLTNVAGAGQNGVEMQIDVINELSSDIVNFFHADLNDTEFDTAGGSTVNFYSVEAFTPDANVAYNGVFVAAITGGAGVEYGINIATGWDQDIFGASQLNLEGENRIDITVDGITDLLILDGSTSATKMDLGGGGSTLTMAAGTTLFGATGTVGVMNGSDSGNGILVTLTNGNHTGTGNTLSLFETAAIIGDAESNLNAILIGALTGTAGAAGEVEQGIDVVGSSATGWDLAASFDAAVELNTYRQDFDGPCRRFEAADGTIELVSDGGTNAATCDGGIHNFTYRLELAQASPFLPSVTGQGLDIENDGADNAGVEILVAHSLDGTTDHSYFIRGQSPAMYFRVNVTIASVSGTDDFVVGWRLSEAFDATATSTNYNTWAVHRINDNAGNLQIATDVNGAADGADENAVQAAFGDTETHTFEVQLSTACVASFYTNGTLNAVTNANDACEAGDIMMPWIMERNTVDADAETVINWIEIGEVI